MPKHYFPPKEENVIFPWITETSKPKQQEDPCEKLQKDIRQTE